jgi:hypothetical protein
MPKVFNRIHGQHNDFDNYSTLKLTYNPYFSLTQQLMGERLSRPLKTRSPISNVSLNPSAQQA